MRTIPENGTKHTAGPWTVKEWHGDKFGEERLIVDTPYNGFGTQPKFSILPGGICNQNLSMDGVTLEEHHANAALISAAPQLLQALKMALLANELLEGMTEEELKKAHYVIKKAEGRISADDEEVEF